MTNDYNIDLDSRVSCRQPVLVFYKSSRQKDNGDHNQPNEIHTGLGQTSPCSSLCTLVSSWCWCSE